MSVLAAVDIDWGALAEAAYLSAIIGIGVLVVAGVGVASSLRAAEARGDGGTSSVGAYGAVTVVCALVVLAVVVAGIYELTQ